jgi:hypothetical protein
MDVRPADIRNSCRTTSLLLRTFLGLTLFAAAFKTFSAQRARSVETYAGPRYTGASVLLQRDIHMNGFHLIA